MVLDCQGVMPSQGCQTVYFRTKNPNFGKFWRDLEWKLLVYFITIWNILWLLVIKFGHDQVVAVWYSFPVLVYLDLEKSGNPAPSRFSNHKFQFGYIM
jgi:hypothetical protein